jgi:endonuclease YncB( thermonuclease family)
MQVFAPSMRYQNRRIGRFACQPCMENCNKLMATASSSRWQIRQTVKTDTVFSLLTICFWFLSFDVHAHGGGLDKEGCHNNRQTGEHHCHHGSKVKLKSQIQATLTGIPKIIDGDTIRIGNTRIRLHGIDAPEAKQTCTVDGKKWQCGRNAANALASIVGEQSVKCSKRNIDRYGRIVAVCRAGPIDLNEWMVGNGWAVAYKRFSIEYNRGEIEAKKAGKGLWRGDFVMPWVWRRRMREGR